jgi:hypothetical protein
VGPQGDFSLHYSRTQGPVDWRVLCWFMSGATATDAPIIVEEGSSFPAEMRQKVQEGVRLISELHLPEPTHESIRSDAAKLGLCRGLPDLPPRRCRLGGAAGQASTSPPGPDTPPLMQESLGEPPVTLLERLFCSLIFHFFF